MLSSKKMITTKRIGQAVAFVAAIVFSLALFSWPRLSNYRQTAFVDASFSGRITTMKLLMALGADVNGFECNTARCRTPLIAAAGAGQSEAVQLLLARGADVNKRMQRGQTALMFASYYGHTELVRVLLARGADVNADFEGDTALSWAKEKDHAEIVNLLIATGAAR